MANRGQGDNIRIVGDFVCEAIPDPPVPADTPAARGKSEGVQVIHEFVVDLGSDGGDGTEGDKPCNRVGVKDVAEPIGTGWGQLFSGAAAAAAFSGLVGGLLRTVSAVAALQKSTPATPTCKFCGRSRASYSLRCCQSATCENCLGRMLSPEQADGVGFRCAFCGHVHSQKVSA